MTGFRIEFVDGTTITYQKNPVLKRHEIGYAFEPSVLRVWNNSPSGQSTQIFPLVQVRSLCVDEVF